MSTATKKATTKKKAPVTKKAPEKAPEVICPNCREDTIVNANSLIGKEIKVMLSNLLKRQTGYHENRLGHLYFDCFRCYQPIYLKFNGNFYEIDTGEEQ